MRKLPYIGILLLAVCSCKVVNTLTDTANELFRGEVVARAGDHVLHLSELEQYIPQGVSSEDSTKLARQFIDAWAQDLLLLDMAEEQLSPSEKDVTNELEDYRRTLLKYRYEQLYINQRLDTLITTEEVNAFYKENSALFRLERPIVKARYLLIPADAKSIKNLRRLMSSEDETEVMEAASLASTSAIKYVDQADTWMDALSLAREMGMDYQKLLSGIRNQFMEYTDENGILHLAYLAEQVPEGKTAPLEYCEDRIRELILSGRKHTLEESLEQDVLEDARKNNKYVIY
ncbi:MAG: hypothetical protein IJP81_01395 [Bacteroidales bacterium]|nr:hypothetical protein [Bacteroidales bacterium]